MNLVCGVRISISWTKVTIWQRFGGDMGIVESLNQKFKRASEFAAL